MRAMRLGDDADDYSDAWEAARDLAREQDEAERRLEATAATKRIVVALHNYGAECLMGGDSLRAKQKVLMALRAVADGKERLDSLALTEAIQAINRER